tara:strand:+ start:1973 stop:2230 length:258 start_codon:yes stop_codon:yes gene_type:complete
VTVGAGGGALVVVLDDDSLLARIAALKEHNDLVGLRETGERDRQRRCPEGGFAAKAIFPQREEKNKPEGDGSTARDGRDARLVVA